MEWVSNLKGIDSICSSFFALVEYLLWSQTVLVHIVVESDLFGELHGLTRHKEVTLLVDPFNFLMFERTRAKRLGTNLFLSIVEELRFLDNSENIILMSRELATFDCDSISALKFCLLLLSNILGDGNG